MEVFHILPKNRYQNILEIFDVKTRENTQKTKKFAKHVKLVVMDPVSYPSFRVNANLLLCEIGAPYLHKTLHTSVQCKE